MLFQTFKVSKTLKVFVVTQTLYLSFIALETYDGVTTRKVMVK